MMRNKKFTTAYNYYQADKVNKPFRMTPSKNTQSRLKAYDSMHKIGKTSTIDLLFALIK